MKEGIHPEYGATTITCASCGQTFKTNSTKKDKKLIFAQIVIHFGQEVYNNILQVVEQTNLDKNMVYKILSNPICNGIIFV